MNCVFLSGVVDRLNTINGEFGPFAMFTLLEHIKLTKRDGSVAEFDKYHACFCRDAGLVDGIENGAHVVVEGRLDSKQVKHDDGTEVMRQWTGRDGKSGESKVYEAQIAVTAIRPVAGLGAEDDLDF